MIKVPVPCSDIDYSELAPGIKETVRLFRENGFETTDSGDGASHTGDHAEDCDCEMPYANVAIVVDPGELAAEADRLAGLLEQLGVQIQPIGWRQAGEMLAFESPDDSPDWDVKEAVEIEASYDPVNNTAVILVLFLDDRKLAKAGLGKRESN